MGIEKSIEFSINNKEIVDALKEISDKIVSVGEVFSSIMSKDVVPNLEEITKTLKEIAPLIQNINTLNQQTLENGKELLALGKEQSEQDKKKAEQNEQQAKKEEDKSKKTLENLQKEMEEKKNFYDDDKALYKEYISELNKLAVVKNGEGIIDKAATEKNLKELGEFYKKYKGEISEYIHEAIVYYDNLMEKADGDEKEQSRLNREKIKKLLDLQLQSETINKAITENTKQQTGLQTDAWKSTMDAVAKYAEGTMLAVNAVFGAIGGVFNDQIEDAKKEAEAAKKEYEGLVNKKKADEAEMQSMKEAQYRRENELAELRDNLTQEQIDNREKDIASLEDSIAKKEKAIEDSQNKEDAAKKKQDDAKKKQEKEEKKKKKLDISQQLIKATADIATGVAKALSYGPILGPILAGIVGTAGAFQIGIISAQFDKLEKGGLLRGKRHSEGGMRIEGTNIEVEGGEYVVNRRSTAKNLGLISYINSQDKELQPGDMSKFFAQQPVFMPPAMQRVMEEGGQIPQLQTTGGMDSEILDAIKAINLQPRVAVTDIIRAQDQYASVENWSGV